MGVQQTGIDTWKLVSMLLGSSVLSAGIGAIFGPLGNMWQNKQLHKQRKEHIVFEKQLQAMQEIMARLADWDKRCPEVFSVFMHINEDSEDENINVEYNFLKQGSVYLSKKIYDFAYDTITLVPNEYEETRCLFIKKFSSDSAQSEKVFYAEQEADDSYRNRIRERIVELKDLIKDEIQVHYK